MSSLSANIIRWHNTFCPYPKGSSLFNESAKRLGTYKERLELKKEFDIYEKKMFPTLNCWIHTHGY